jgi:C-terminal processing protease CtpA/Prc
MSFGQCQAGLSEGQIITTIDDVPAAGKDLKDCVDLIHGAIATKVRLELIDPEQTEDKTVELTRQRIQT